MALTISIQTGARPSIHIVPPSRVVQEANKLGHAHAAQALALTSPRITIDQTGLYFPQRRGTQGLEFQFQSGTLLITLKQDIFLDNTLSTCAQGKWEAHERVHVQDNQRVTRSMEPSLRREPKLQGILINPTWHPRTDFVHVQQVTEQAVGDIFRAITAAAAATRDTFVAYRTVNRDILTGCPEPYQYTVESGDTLSKIALYFYNRASAWPTILQANQQTIGSNPDRISVGQVLIIPKSP